MGQASELNISEITREIKDPLDNIMAYTRLYQGTIDKESQHWKDLVEIVEQANRIQEIVHRVESTTNWPVLFQRPAFRERLALF